MTYLLFFSLCLSVTALDEPLKVHAHGKQLRIDLSWKSEGQFLYQVRRAPTADGEFNIMPYCTTIPVFSDFIGEEGKSYYYQVRKGTEQNKKFVATSKWSKTVFATSLKLNEKTLSYEFQEAATRYFSHGSHPESGLAREWLNTRWTEGQSWSEFSPAATGATGMGLANLVVAAERAYLERKEAAKLVLKALRFLDTKAERFHGAFSHWIDNKNGKTIPFSKFDDGGDLPETALLMQGVIIAREYFNKNIEEEKEIRNIANRLWREVNWNWYRKDGGDQLMWHWSPKHGWKVNLPIIGFCEAEIAYILAVASPSHPVPVSTYFKGWRSGWYGSNRKEMGIDLKLGQGLGGCTFWYYYSYIGLNPQKINFKGQSMQKHFEDLCKVQIKYMRSLAGKYKGYDKMWGLTASAGPDGYRGHKPGPEDNGTIGSTAAVSAFLYAPEESIKSLNTMYQEYGKQLWQEVGPCHAFNPERKWFYNSHLGIDTGTIAPMLENYRSGLLWKLFMNAPEIKSALKKLEQSHKNTVNP